MKTQVRMSPETVVHYLMHIGIVGLARVQRTVLLVSTPISLSFGPAMVKDKGLRDKSRPLPPLPDPEQNQVADSINLSTDLN